MQPPPTLSAVQRPGMTRTVPTEQHLHPGHHPRGDDTCPGTVVQCPQLSLAAGLVQQGQPGDGFAAQMQTKANGPKLIVLTLHPLHLFFLTGKMVSSS